MWKNKNHTHPGTVLREYHDAQTGQKIKEIHKCPLGIVVNPFWLKMFFGALTVFGSLGVWGIEQGYSFANTASSTIQKHEMVINQIQQANLPDRIVRIEAYQQVSHEVQDRMETKLDRMFEVWHQPNPAPKPDSPISR